MPYPRCRHCNQEETVIDLRDIPEDSYTTGERIIGDLENLGWIVCRGIRMTEENYSDINKICADGRWWHVDTRGNCRIKYQYTTPYVKDDLNTSFPQLRHQINTQILAKVLPKDQKYKIGKYNFLQNQGMIVDDQEPHRDYPARLST